MFSDPEEYKISVAAVNLKVDEDCDLETSYPEPKSIVNGRSPFAASAAVAVLLTTPAKLVVLFQFGYQKYCQFQLGF